MGRGAVTEAEILASLQELAERIERGGLKAVTIRAKTDEGEIEHTFPLETQEQRDAALLFVKQVLGQVH